MRTDTEIAVARHMAAAHDAHCAQNPYQRAALYGMKTALGMNKFEMPKTKDSWVLLLQTICEQCDYKEYHDFRHRIPRAFVPKTVDDWKQFREVATQVGNWYEMPPLHIEVLRGMRIACAWVMEIPGQGYSLEMLYQGAVLQQAEQNFNLANANGEQLK
jgi:hypothetical protein